MIPEKWRRVIFHLVADMYWEKEVRGFIGSHGTIRNYPNWCDIGKLGGHPGLMAFDGIVLME